MENGTPALELKGRTPMMQQYFGAREQHPGVLLLMRVGDFYEAYGEDACTIAEALNITLTGREDSGQRLAMAGVPHHAVERYVAMLIKRGLRVALMDQVEDPKTAKGLVKRRVTRIVSPGTVFEDNLLDARSNNYLVAAVVDEPVAGLGVVDVSTGEFLTTEIGGDRHDGRLVEEICRLDPAEVLVPDTNPELAERIRAATGAPVILFSPKERRSSISARELLTTHFGTHSLRGFGCEEYTAGLDAAALVLDYLKENQVGMLSHIQSMSTYSTDRFMVLDSTARKNLELTSSLTDGGRARTLLSVLDHTLTPMGGRMLRRWLEEPLLDPDRINARLDAVEELAGDELLRGDLREALRGINDIERLVSRCAAGLAGPRDLVGLRDSLQRLPGLRARLSASRSLMLCELAERMGAGGTPVSAGPSLLAEQREVYMGGVQDVAELIVRALRDDPPAALHDGGVIRPGYSVELDTLREAASQGRTWIASLEAEERTRTGIASLKVGYNAVFGYYIEVTRTHLAKVPQQYIRKQTTAGAERYITPELKEFEARVLGADEKAAELEGRLFITVRERVSERSGPLLQAARSVARLDLLAGMAEAAVRHHYVRPTVDAGEVIDVRRGRHPVVEQLHTGIHFVPNDCLLDCCNNQLHIITGPNMAGKSTVLRQVALIALMAQAGSFVPADSATIGVVDRIFTRVGAHDELATGQSTFMVEMSETASILNNATRRSLVVLDEIGRGTSTYDGLSIAWAVAEQLTQIGCRTLFATHYHHLNDLAAQNSHVKNYRVAVKEKGDRILWLHLLVPGGTDKSYGIQVARMAGVPPGVVGRASEILAELERNSSKATRDIVAPGSGISTTTRKLQLTLFDLEKPRALSALEDLDIGTMSPVEALIKLDELQRLSREQ